MTEVAALPENELYLQHVSVLDDLPARDYVARLPVVRALRKSGGFWFHSPVTIFVGENGVGKSTLIEAIAVACRFNPEGGTANFDFATRASHSSLGEYLRTLKGTRRRRDGFFLRAESFYNVASNIDELDEELGLGTPVIASYGGVSLHRQSHSESFMALVANRFGGKGLYILDEPGASGARGDVGDLSHAALRAWASGSSPLHIGGSPPLRGQGRSGRQRPRAAAGHPPLRG